MKSRGFASMDLEKRRKIAAMGGHAVKAKDRAFSKDRDLAVRAGRKGGLNVSNEKRSFSLNRDLAAAAGRKGGANSNGSRRRVMN
jgi:general stress protein YciG